jgi:hypothetical protein
MIYCMIISQYTEKCRLFYLYVVWYQGELVVSKEEEESKIKTCFSADAKFKGTDITYIRNYCIMLDLEWCSMVDRGLCITKDSSGEMATEIALHQ